MRTCKQSGVRRILRVKRARTSVRSEYAFTKLCQKLYKACIISLCKIFLFPRGDKIVYPEDEIHFMQISYANEQCTKIAHDQRNHFHNNKLTLTETKIAPLFL